MNIKAGVHESGGPLVALNMAHARGSNCMQMFAKNKLSYSFAKDFRKLNERFAEFREAFDVETVVHASYLINIPSKKDGIGKMSASALIQELDAATFLGAKYVVLHPGSQGGHGDRAEGIRLLKDALRFVLLDTTWKPKLLLETMPGGKNDTQIGGFLDELADVVTTLKAEGANIGVCFDTCHVHAAGYDYAENWDNYNNFWNQWFSFFNQWPDVLHINGAAHKRGSKKDGHATLNGKFDVALKSIDVSIPPQTFNWIRFDERFKDSVHILETPIQYHQVDLPKYLSGETEWNPLEFQLH